jgi:glycosyltransferase involved in cell wall biosynthesis
MSVRQVGYFLRGTIYEPQEQPRPLLIPLDREATSRPLISCIMPTRGHLFPARHAIDCFLRQDYPNRELVVVCASTGSEVERYLEQLSDPRIHFHHVPSAQVVGEMRNFAVTKANGELISVWDDDDLSHPSRLSIQLGAMQASEAKAAFLARVILWSPVASRLAITERRFWEGTMLVERAVMPDYQKRVRGSDSVVLLQIKEKARMALIDHPASYCYVLHGRNLWGAGHFASFFARATRNFEGAEYAETIKDLGVEMPIAEYALNFFQHLRGPGAGRPAAPGPGGDGRRQAGRTRAAQRGG